MFAIPLATYQPTDNARRFVATFLRAIGRCRLTAKEAAGLQGLKEPQWHLQVKGEGAHISAYRMGDLLLSHPQALEYWLEELRELVVTQRAEEADVRKLIDRVQVFLLQLQALDTTKKPMAKADLPPADTQERTA